MLADTGRYDGLATRVPIDFLDDGVGLDQVAVAIVIQAMLRFECGDLVVSGRIFFLEPDALAVREQIIKVLTQYADVMPIDAFDFANF